MILSDPYFYAPISPVDESYNLPKEIAKTIKKRFTNVDVKLLSVKNILPLVGRYDIYDISKYKLNIANQPALIQLSLQCICTTLYSLSYYAHATRFINISPPPEITDKLDSIRREIEDENDKILNEFASICKSGSFLKSSSFFTNLIKHALTTADVIEDAISLSNPQPPYIRLEFDSATIRDSIEAMWGHTMYDLTNTIGYIAATKTAHELNHLHTITNPLLANDSHPKGYQSLIIKKAKEKLKINIKKSKALDTFIECYNIPSGYQKVKHQFIEENTLKCTTKSLPSIKAFTAHIKKPPHPHDWARAEAVEIEENLKTNDVSGLCEDFLSEGFALLGESIINRDIKKHLPNLYEKYDIKSRNKTPEKSDDFIETLSTLIVNLITENQ